MWLLDTNALIHCHKFSEKKLFINNFTFTTIFCLIEFPVAIRYEELSILYPNAKNYKSGLKYALKLREKGIQIPTIDILNGTIAVDRNICLVTDDLHFKSFKSIEPHLKFISSEIYTEKIQEIS